MRVRKKEELRFMLFQNPRSSFEINISYQRRDGKNKVIVKVHK
jgi:hypothetical protein